MRKLIITSSLILAMGASTPAFAAGPKFPETHQHSAIVLVAATVDGGKVDAARAAQRDLWIGHVFWVRNVVTSGIAGDKAAQQAAEKQVVANAQAIAGAIEPFYGSAAKDKLFGLLAAHYGAVKAYLDAAIAKDAAKQTEATNKLLANAGEIAVFLSSANPNLPKETVEGLLQGHGGHHITQIQQLLAKDYTGEAKTWADMTQHMYVIADALGGAIAKQFPGKFAAK
ncbi:MAG: hypothetical protein ABL908_07865 [Hyphomicrobium sp.]